MEEKLPKRRRFIINVAYWAFILVICYLIFRYLLNLLLPFIIAILVAWLLRMPCKWYARKLPGKKKLVSALVVATVVLFYLIIGGLVLLLVVDLIGDLAGYLRQIPTIYTQTIEPGLTDIYEKLQALVLRLDPGLADVVNKALPEMISTVSSAVTNFSVSAVGKLTSIATSVPGFLLGAVISVIATIFTATSFDAIKGFFKRNLPEKFTSTAGYAVTSFRNIIMQYGKSYALIMLITFGEIALGLIIIGVKRPLLIALLIAIFDIFPIVGSGMILLPWAIITLIQGHMLRGISLGILYLVVVILRQFLEPKVVGKQVGLPPLVTLAGMFVGSSLFGVWGLFGFPITAAIIVNLNNDPDVPITIYRRDPEEEALEHPPGRIVYRFRRKGGEEAPPRRSKRDRAQKK